MERIEFAIDLVHLFTNLRGADNLPIHYNGQTWLNLSV